MSFYWFTYTFNKYLLIVYYCNYYFSKEETRSNHKSPLRSCHSKQCPPLPTPATFQLNYDCSCLGSHRLPEGRFTSFWIITLCTMYLPWPLFILCTADLSHRHTWLCDFHVRNPSSGPITPVSYTAQVQDVLNGAVSLFPIVSIIHPLSSCPHFRLQWGPTPCNPMDCTLPGSSVLGFSRQEYSEWIAVLSPVDIPKPEIKPISHVSYMTGRFHH